MYSGRINPPLVLTLTLMAFLTSASPGSETFKGRLLLSSGEAFVGDLFLTKGKSISIFDTTRGKKYRLSLSEIQRIAVQVESESMEEKWVFKEDSSDEKIKSGKRYPVKRYLSEITLRAGGKIVGHTVFVIYVRTAAGKKKFILRNKHTGKVGQKPSDLVYVKEIVLDGSAAGDEATGVIFGKINVKDRLVSVRAIRYERNLLFEGALTGDSTFEVTGLTDGTYDLIVETSRSLFLWFSDDRESVGRPLTEADKRSFAEWIASLRDFFDVQKPINVVGTTKKARALVLKERHGRTSYPGVGLVRRYDIWTFHKLGKEWRIDDRKFICRELVKSSESVPLKKVITDERLGRKVINSAHKRVEVDLFLDD